MYLAGRPLRPHNGCMETAFVDWLKRRLPPHPLLRLGVGDDAAALSLGERAECVVTVDMLTDEVDFRLDQVDPRRVGRKALAVNLSDLAAMASQPLAVVIALALPRRGAAGLDAAGLAMALYEGLLPLAERYHVAIAGGDTNTWDGALVLSITAIGAVGPRGVLKRSGARPGDKLLATGRFGGSILGKHLDFEPRVEESLLLHERYELHAGIDVSDGLSLDVARLAAASGCAVHLRLDAVPVAPDAHRLAERLADGTTPLDHALADGEDFELILAVPPEEADRLLADQPVACGLTCIGEFAAGAGLWQVDGSGRPEPLAPRGYEHRA